MTDALIVPKKGKKEDPVQPVVALVAIERDVPLVKHAAGIKGVSKTRILTSSLFENTDRAKRVTVAGPMVGAPYAILVLEKLIALGAKQVVFLGWCGSFQGEIKTGDLIVPTGARVGEGTSPYYTDEKESMPSGAAVEAIVQSCKLEGLPYHKGTVWSTDAPYRETKKKVISLQKAGVLGVDMEVSALFTVARHRGIGLGALMVVSDELASLKWKPGFSNPTFKEARKRAAKIVVDACKYMVAEEI